MIRWLGVVAACVVVALGGIGALMTRYTYDDRTGAVIRTDRWTGRHQVAIPGYGWYPRGVFPQAAPDPLPPPPNPQHHYAVITSTLPDGSGPSVEMVDAPSEQAARADPWIAMFHKTVWAVREVDPVFTYNVTIAPDDQPVTVTTYLTFKARDDAQAREIVQLFHQNVIRFERVTLGDPTP
jgi:hypothetical protein